MPSLRSFRPLMRPGVASLLAALAVTVTLASTLAARADAPGWPRQIDSSSGTVVMYQPQAEDLRGDLLTSRAAFSLQRSGEATPVFGVLWFTERIQIDRDSNEVQARSLDVTKVRMPNLNDADAREYEHLIESEATQWDLSGSLDELHSELAATEKERASTADLDNTPPKILVVPERAILVVYDGQPTLEPIEDTHFERVANTPYAVVFDPSRGDYYLSGANVWYTAKDPLGPWQDADRVPSAVRDLVPPDTLADDQLNGPTPRVITATEPTELIATDGPPRYAPLVGSELLYVTNTESDVVREVRTQAIYVLLAGRWYTARSFNGPWTFVRGDQLPPSFRRIPADSPKGNLLASIAGTDQAEDAIADAEIPQTSAIRRGVGDLVILYDGPPQFERIPGTDLQYAVNTDAQVILADGRYYACDQGVWYISDDPDGPWTVSETRPIGLEDIPASCPVYNTMYVYVYDVTPDVIYTGYVPGYVGCYPYYGTVVYGTGHRYKPWRGHHHYYPRPCTFGFGARYNPWLSRWSFGFSYNAGFLRIGARWHPWPQAVHRHGPPAWFGPGGYHRPQLADDHSMLRQRRPRAPRPGDTDRAPTNIYNRTENVVRVDRGALRKPVYGISRPDAHATRLPNNVYAGKDGKVYQRDDSGKWKVNDGPKWKPTPVPVKPTQPVSGGWSRYGGDRGSNQPSVHPTPQPMPTQPAQPTWQQQPRQTPTPRPTPQPMPVRPSVSPTPGNLEREYRARERSSPQVAPAPRQAPAPQPAREERKQEKQQEKQQERQQHEKRH